MRLNEVTFSDEKVDLIISGKERASEGKGFRAIAYAAFMIGLLDFRGLDVALPTPALLFLISACYLYSAETQAPTRRFPRMSPLRFMRHWRNFLSKGR